MRNQLEKDGLPLDELLSEENKKAEAEAVVNQKRIMVSSRMLRTTEEMVTRAASLTDLSIEALEDVVRHGSKDSDRIAAAIALLDRGHGKATQQVNLRSNAGNTIKEAVRFCEDNGLIIDGQVIEVKS